MYGQTSNCLSFFAVTPDNFCQVTLSGKAVK